MRLPLIILLGRRGSGIVYLRRRPANRVNACYLFSTVVRAASFMHHSYCRVHFHQWSRLGKVCWNEQRRRRNAEGEVNTVNQVLPPLRHVKRDGSHPRSTPHDLQIVSNEIDISASIRANPADLEPMSRQEGRKALRGEEVYMGRRYIPEPFPARYDP
jgi:hypothetical protein